jgi:serine protease Do
VDVRGLRRGAESQPWQPLRLHLRIGVNPAAADTGQPSPLSRIGLSALNIPADVRQQIELDSEGGVLVESVAPGGVAEEAGLRAGDIIVEVNRTEVGSRVALETALLQARSERIPLVVRRQNKMLFLVLQRADLQQ